MTTSEAAGAAAPDPTPLPPSLTMRIETLSDWHVGDGSGRPGGVDAVVCRDADGVPYLPGTTVTGLLRDACEQVALNLDGGMPLGTDGTPTPRAMADAAGRPWFRWAVYLFGARVGQAATTSRAVVRVRPAFASSAVRAELKKSRALRDAAVFAKPGVRIDPVSGRAQDAMLRMIEVARSGLALRAQVEIDALASKSGLTEDQRRAASALLVAGTAWLRAAGADRNRGLGEIRAALTWPEHAADGFPECVDRWLAWMERVDDPVPPPAPGGRSESPLLLGGAAQQASGDGSAGVRATASTASPAAADGSVGGWVCVPLTLTTIDPVRIPRLTLGNLVMGRDHIPGTTLLSWLLRRSPAPSVLRAAFVAGDAVVTDATPVVNGHRGRPAPAALAESKYDQVAGRLINRLYPHVGDGDSRGLLGAKPLRRGWVTGLVDRHPESGEPCVTVDTTAPVMVTHNVATPLAGRPTSADGGVYTVEAIPAGRVLRAELRVRADLAPAVEAELGEAGWAALATPSARVGSRTGSSYGRVLVTVDEPSSTPAREVAPGGVFVLWATSDVLVRDAWLRLSGDPDDVVAELRRRFAESGAQVSLELAPVDREENAAAQAAWAMATRGESWQSGWGLPRPTLVGMAAGSCLRLRLTNGHLDAALISEICTGGLGERRGEGFGQVDLVPEPPGNAAPEDASVVVLNGPWPKADVAPARAGKVRGPVPSAADSDLPGDGTDAAYVATVRRAALSQALADLAFADEQPTDTAAGGEPQKQPRDRLIEAMKGVTASQAGRLRAVVAAARGGDVLRPLEQHISRNCRKPKQTKLMALLTELRNGGVRPLLRAACHRVCGDESDDLPCISDIGATTSEALALLVVDALDQIRASRAAEGDSAETVGHVPGPGELPQVTASDTTSATGADGKARTRNRRASRTQSATSGPSQRTELRAVHTRYELVLPLVATTPLHVGGAHDDAHIDLTVAQNGRGRPYVPGSSLAGAVRARWLRLCPDQRIVAERTAAVWDGLARRTDWQGTPKPPEDFLASLIRVADAELEFPGDEDAPQREVRDGVGIDRFTGAAAFRIKYDREVVRAGARLTLCLVADDCEPPDAHLSGSRLEAELKAFAENIADHGLTLGAATTRGLGRLALATDDAAVQPRLTRRQLSGREGMVAAVRSTVRPADNSADRVWDLAHRVNPAQSRSAPPDVLRIEIAWAPETPVIVGGALPSATAQLLPLVSSRPDTGEASLVLPGSSVKGVFRAEAERMLLTLFPSDVSADRDRFGFTTHLAAIAKAFPPFGALFGTQDQRAALSVADTFAKLARGALPWTKWNNYLVQPKPGEQEPGEQKSEAKAQNLPTPGRWAKPTTRTAVDRWTGGAADGLLYTTLEPVNVGWEPLVFDIDVRRLLDALTHRAEETTDDTGSAEPDPGTAATDGTRQAALQLGRQRAAAVLALFLGCVAEFCDGRMPLGRGGNRGLGQPRVKEVRFDLAEKTDAPLLPGLQELRNRKVKAADGAAGRAAVWAVARELCEAQEITTTWTDLLRADPAPSLADQPAPEVPA